MRLWRVFNPDYQPLSATGSGKYGGRWNPIGCPVLYLGENLSLVAWERYVHLSVDIRANPAALRLSVVFVDLTPIIIESMAHLPNLNSDWHERKDYTQNIGLQWVNNEESAILRVPSVVIEHQYNYLLNPAHPLSKNFLQEISPKTFPFKYDSRS